MTAAVLSGREALQAWLRVCVNLARRSGVLTLHSNDMTADQARHWVTVTGVREINTATSDEMYAMAEQLSQAFATAAIEYAKGNAPEPDAALVDALLVKESDRLRAKIAELEAKIALITLRAEHPQIGSWERAVGSYAQDDAHNVIEYERGRMQYRALRELRNVMSANGWRYVVQGGDGLARAAYLMEVETLVENLPLLATAIGMDRERSQDGQLEPLENLRARLRTWNAPTPTAGASEDVDD